MQRKTFSSLYALLYALTAMGCIAGLYAAGRRYSVEQRNRGVELALEYSELRQLAQVTGRHLPVVLSRFKQAGITSLAITEDTLAGLESRGQIHVQDWNGTTVSVSSPELMARIKAALAAKGFVVHEGRDTKQDTVFEAAGGDEEAPDNQAPAGFAVAADYSTLRPLGIGLDPQAVADTRGAGLIPVGRIANWPGVTPTSMVAVLNALKQQAVQTVIFQGLEVLGFRDSEKEAASALQLSGIQYGQVEFGKQKGDDKLGIDLKGKYIRVHSIGEAEMGTLDMNEAIDRFVRAARERNIRLCYIRLFTMAGADPVQTNFEYLDKIARGIARGREMEFRAAHLFDETRVPSAVFGVIALGVAAGFVLLLSRLAPLNDRAVLGTLAVSVLLCAGCALALGETGRKLVALLAALVFPTLACLRRDLLGDQRPRTNGERPVLEAIRDLFLASAVTALGIISVVGLLASRSFIVKANQFLGIKAAHALPVLIIGLLAITGMPQVDKPWHEEWGRLKARVRGFFHEPARVGQLLIALVALVAFAMVVARTGNDPGVGVSGLELKFRAILDRILPVRPRTKEFLVGHPAWVLALAFWYTGRRKWALPLFVVGVIGQVSILNTFCHTHTPLRLSLIRDVTGLVFGAAVGAAAYWILDRFVPRTEPQLADCGEADPLRAPAGREAAGAVV